MKKLFALVVSLIMVLCIFNANAFAGYDSNTIINASVFDTEQLGELQNQFVSDVYNGFNYAYYSPVKSESDTTKYPLVVFIHGFGHELSYLSKSWMPFWTLDEVQSQFAAGGAYVLLPQVWHLFSTSSELQTMIENFVDENKNNIDTSEIVIMGASLGGRRAYQLVTQYPDFYSDAVIVCPAVYFHEDELKNAANVPIWLISSRDDPLTGNHKDSWEIMLRATNVPEKCRWTYFDGTVYIPDGTSVNPHFLAKVIACDGLLVNGESYSTVFGHVTVIDGLGNNIEMNSNNGIVHWIENN